MYIATYNHSMYSAYVLSLFYSVSQRKEQTAGVYLRNLISGDVSNDAPHSSYELISLIVNVQKQLRPDHMIIRQAHQLRIQLSQLRVCMYVHGCILCARVHTPHVRTCAQSDACIVADTLIANVHCKLCV